MINFNEVFATFSAENKTDFINYLDKKNKRKDAKNIQYVKLLFAENLSTKEICNQLYTTDNKVAFHALRKRLFQSLIDFTANESIKSENSTDIQLIKYIISARNFMQKRQFEIGYKILDKALIIADENQLFTILNEIYHTKIEFAHEYSKVNIDVIIAQFEENQQKLILEEKLNIVYAKIRKSLNAINHQHKTIDIKELITYSLQESNLKISSDLSFKALYQIIQITNLASAKIYNYYAIKNFVVDIYEIVENHPSKNKQLFYQIEVLYSIANIFFRNKEFDKSLNYLDKMHIVMLKNNAKFLKEFTPKHQLLVALNNNYSGNQLKAMELLEPFILKENVALESQLDIYLALIVFYQQKKELKKAQRIFSNFYHTDKYYTSKAGIDWTIKKSLLEILLQIDLENINMVESRILSFKRNYFDYLQNRNQQKVITYLKLIEIYFKNPELVTSKAFADKVEKSFNWLSIEKEDLFMISFYAWLKAKMIKQDVYTVTLDFMKN